MHAHIELEIVTVPKQKATTGYAISVETARGSLSVHVQQLHFLVDPHVYAVSGLRLGSGPNRNGRAL